MLRANEDVLLRRAEALEETLAADIAGREGEWIDSVNDALCALKKSLWQQYATTNAPENLIILDEPFEAALAAPLPGMRGLQPEVLDFLDWANSLQLMVQKTLRALGASVGPSQDQESWLFCGVGATPDLDAIRHRGEHFVRAFQQHREAESEEDLESACELVEVAV